MPEFMLLIKGGDYDGMSPEQSQKVVEKFIAWAGKLRQQGRYKAGDELQPNGRIVSASNGAITDGPFTETKDAVGGYFLIEAKDYDEAVAICREAPHFEYNGTIEIRQISDYS